MNAVVHQYYKFHSEELVLIVQINPITLSGLEILMEPDGKIEKTSRQFEPDIYEDLAADGFEEASALEFNLYLKGLANPDFSL